MFRYVLRTPAGDDAGEVSTSKPVSVGDHIRLDRDRVVEVTAIVPLERIGEFVDSATNGILEVVEIGESPKGVSINVRTGSLV